MGAAAKMKKARLELVKPEKRVKRHRLHAIPVFLQIHHDKSAVTVLVRCRRDNADVGK